MGVCRVRQPIENRFLLYVNPVDLPLDLHTLLKDSNLNFKYRSHVGFIHLESSFLTHSLKLELNIAMLSIPQGFFSQ